MQLKSDLLENITKQNRTKENRTKENRTKERNMTSTMTATTTYKPKDSEA